MNELLNLIANIVVFGLVLWLVQAYIPLPGVIQSLLQLVVVIVLVLYILQFFGIISTIVPMYRIIR